jgi:hypothetical protein
MVEAGNAAAWLLLRIKHLACRRLSAGIAGTLMTKKFMWLVVVASALAAVASRADEGAAKSEWILNLAKKSYTLKRALAYETTIDNEDAIVVLLSGPAVSSEELKEARKTEKDGSDPSFNRPFLRLVFKKTGELKHWSASAGGTTMGRQSSKATGELKQQNDRVSGTAALANDPDAMISGSFDVRFDTKLIKASEELPAATPKKPPGPAANVKPTVTGVFKGNGKEAKIEFVSAHWTEPFDGKPGITLVFTEKDHSKVKKPDFDASFGKFGSALVVSLHEDGSIYGCQVAHSAHKKQGFSSVGSIETSDFSFADGKIEGEITTNGQQEFFGDTWEVKLKFVAPLGEIPKEFQVPESKKEEKPPSKTNDNSPKKDAATDDDDDDATAAPESKVSGLNVKELALTKDATDVEYKQVVEHVLFKSKSDVKSACAELSANLKAQGWTNDGADMIQPQSSILKRKRGASKLTIFVKPAPGGGQVQMFTEGLSW